MARVGLKQIAEKAGVSAVTVSAALNGTGRVGQKKRAEIRRIANELNYQSNTIAQLLKSKQKDGIGLIVNDSPGLIMASGVLGGLVVDFISYCEARGIKYRIEFVDPDSGKDCVPDILASGYVGGIILAGYLRDHQTQFKSWLAAHHEFPFVKFEEPHEFSVRTDFVKGIHDGLKVFSDGGHQNVALHVGPLQFDAHNLVNRGFRQGVGMLSLTCREEWIHNDTHGPDERELKLAWFKKIMAAEDRPTAMICAGMGASRNIINFAYRLGLDIPRDLSILGIGPAWQATAMYPHVSAIERDLHGMLESALEILQRRINGKGVIGGEKWIEPKLRLRETVQSR
jgi:LacI family transcriptional regulator